jgi:hypothetical protein
MGIFLPRPTSLPVGTRGGERMTFMTPQAIVDTLCINTVPLGIYLLREEFDKGALG